MKTEKNNQLFRAYYARHRETGEGLRPTLCLQGARSGAERGGRAILINAFEPHSNLKAATRLEQT